MMLLAVLGNLAFTLVGAVVGVRLLLLARRTRQLPELYVGGALTLYSLVAQPLFVASRPLGLAFGSSVWLSVLAVGLVALTATFTGVFAFTRIVFHPGSALAAAATWAGGVCAAVAAGVLWFSLAGSAPGQAYSDLTRGALAVLSLDFCAGMGWTAIEALRYHGMLRRRRALGMADPVIVDRFRVWGIGCSACSLMAFSNVAYVAAGFNMVSHPAPLLSTAAAGVTIAVCWYLSFLPPQGYLRRVRARAMGANGVS